MARPDPKKNASELRKSRKPKKKYRGIKKQTSKEATAKQNYSAVIRKKAAELLDKFGCDTCEGCLRTDTKNNWSHHIPKSVRKDLECDPNNLARMCQGGCHDLVELGRWDELEEEVAIHIEEYIKENDIDYYNLKKYKS